MTDNKEEEDFGDNCLIEDEPEDGDDVNKTYNVIGTRSRHGRYYKAMRGNGTESKGERCEESSKFYN